MEAYENSRHELELLRIPARGEKEIEAGKRYDLEGVCAGRDSLLKAKKHCKFFLLIKGAARFLQLLLKSTETAQARESTFFSIGKHV
jgi:hypothetical protein